MAAENIRIGHPEKDHPLVPKENLLQAFSPEGAVLGSAALHAYSDPDLEPLHPDNISFGFHPPPDKPLTLDVKDALLEAVLERAFELKGETGSDQIRLYSCLFPESREQIGYLLQRGFKQDESMLILERKLSLPPAACEIPDGLTLRDDLLASQTQLDRLLAAHGQVFPRHPYGKESLQKMAASQGWLNLTLLANQQIAGNIMLMMDNSHPSSGWIEDLFISKRFRRNGAATFLLYSGLDHFQNLGLSSVRLELWSANLAARSLYEKFDFRAVAESEIALARMV